MHEVGIVNNEKSNIKIEKEQTKGLIVEDDISKINYLQSINIIKNGAFIF